MGKYVPQVNKLFKKLIIMAVIGAVLLMLMFFAMDRYVKYKGAAHVVAPDHCPPAQAAIVLGAYVTPQGTLCPMLSDRVEAAVELYRLGIVQKLIMSGDHGREDYDEVNAMRRHAQQLGIPARDIFTDHAGFSTYDSMYRARDVFQVQSAVVVTQAFHLPRAVFIARALGLDAVGVQADRRAYPENEINYLELREITARLKAFTQVFILRSQPRFLGDVIPVTGDGRLSHDGN